MTTSARWAACVEERTDQPTYEGTRQRALDRRTPADAYQGRPTATPLAVRLTTTDGELLRGFQPHPRLPTAAHPVNDVPRHHSGGRPAVPLKPAAHLHARSRGGPERPTGWPPRGRLRSTAAWPDTAPFGFRAGCRLGRGLPSRSDDPGACGAVRCPSHLGDVAPPARRSRAASRHSGARALAQPRPHL